MPRTADKRGRSIIKGLFAHVPRVVMESPAYSGASLPARAVLFELAMLFNGSNNGRLGLSARQAAVRLRCSKDTAGRAFRELQERGLIEPTYRGDFRLKELSLASEWRLTWRRCDRTNNLPSNAYRKWKPEGDELPQKSAVRRCGQNGPKSGTADGEAASIGPTTGTVSADFCNPRSDHRDTLRLSHGRGEP